MIPRIAFQLASKSVSRIGKCNNETTNKVVEYTTYVLKVSKMKFAISGIKFCLLWEFDLHFAALH